MKLIDSHCHLDFPDFDLDRDEILQECWRLGLGAIVIPGTCARHWERLLETVASESRLFPALGLHPMFMGEHEEEHLEILADQIKTHRPVAIGEIGLDFYQGQENANDQLHFFARQLDLSQTFDIPVILHVRKAHDQALSLLRKRPVIGGIVHAFNGSFQQAKQYIELGFLLGFGGAMTYERANHIRRLASELPLESIALETDAPDMSPAECRGQRNSPANLMMNAQVLCQLQSGSQAVIARETSRNVSSLLGLPADILR